MRTLSYTALLVPALLPVFGCGAPDDDLVVYAAASLTTVLDSATAVFERETGIRIAVRTGGSGQLAVEIENGAPADLFLGANEAWMDLLATQGRIDTTTRRVVATTRLVAVVPGGPGDPPLRKLPQSPSDLLDLDRIAIGDTESVPAGIYTRQAFEHLGLWDGLEPKLIQTHDVRAALALAERGEVDAAVVYAPDAAISDRVHTVFAFPDTAHNPVRYTGAVIRDAPHTHAASRFLNFLTAGAGRRILASHGFTPRSEP